MRVSARRFVFNASAIADLKDKAISLGVKNPTRVEVITACLAKVSELCHNSQNVHWETSFGQQLHCTSEEAELDSLLCQLREAIRKSMVNL
ncbi:conserved hypothetical protein [Ricinus communis]|uniref:Uncharacterized protein n=1 Tax=Ricinus communis TaxID=3988 RepID=B9R8L8_RICCO|nr:conserved hypothetical protein [Ricinus communis]